MRTAFVVVMCLASSVATTPALAQPKTAQACQDEWRANRDAYEAAGFAFRAYMYKCRGGDTAAPAAAPAAPATPATPVPIRGQTGSKMKG
jgi:hypothetical protein